MLYEVITKKTHTTDVNHLAKLSVSEVSSSSATCFGYADGTLDVEVLGRAINNNLSTINWTRTNPAGWSLTGAVNDGTDRTVQNALTSGDYSVIVEDEYGCVATSLSVTISAPAEISASETITVITSYSIHYTKLYDAPDGVRNEQTERRLGHQVEATARQPAAPVQQATLPSPVPVDPDDDAGTQSDDSSPLVAADEDLIEKEWA